MYGWGAGICWLLTQPSLDCQNHESIEQPSREVDVSVKVRVCGAFLFAGDWVNVKPALGFSQMTTDGAGLADALADGDALGDALGDGPTPPAPLIGSVSML